MDQKFTSGGVGCELSLDPTRSRWVGGWLQESGVGDRTPGCRHNWVVSVQTVFTVAGPPWGDLAGWAEKVAPSLGCEKRRHKLHPLWPESPGTSEPTKGMGQEGSWAQRGQEVSQD